MAAARPVRQPAAIESLDQVLASAEHRKRFQEFCEQSYAVENMHFYQAIEVYETLPTLTARYKTAKQLVAKYIQVGSTEQVNLSADLRERLIKECSSQAKCGPQLFREAKAEVFDLMNKNFFNRFMQAEQALAALSEFPGSEGKEIEANKRIVSSYFARHSEKEIGMDRFLSQSRSSGNLRPNTMKSFDEAILPIQEQMKSQHKEKPSKDGKGKHSKEGAAPSGLRQRNLVVLKGPVPQTESELKDFLESFYGLYAQDKLGEVKNLAAHFVGKGQQLMARLEKKYTVTFIPHDGSADEIMCRVLFEQLWHFYSRYDQSKLDRVKLIAIVNWAISHSVGALNEMLRNKYGRDLNINIILCV